MGTLHSRARAGAAPLNARNAARRAVIMSRPGPHIPRPRGRGPVEVPSPDERLVKLPCKNTLHARRGRGPVEAKLVAWLLLQDMVHSAPARARPR